MLSSRSCSRAAKPNCWAAPGNPLAKLQQGSCARELLASITHFWRKGAKNLELYPLTDCSVWLIIITIRNRQHLAFAYFWTCRGRYLPRWMHFWIRFHYLLPESDVTVFCVLNFRSLPEVVHLCRLCHDCGSSSSCLDIRNDFWTNQNTKRLSPKKQNSSIERPFKFHGCF